jgi:hypothetical protein
VALENLIDPEVMDDDVYPTMLVIFFAGLRALSEAGHAPVAAGAKA